MVSVDLGLRLIRRSLRRRAAQLKFPKTASHELPLLFGNSFPKSGTHLLTQILSGFTRLGPFVESGLPAVLTFEGDTGVPSPLGKILSELRLFLPGDIGYGHLHALPETVAVLTNKGTATIFIYRDPRDVAVSHAFYVGEINRRHAHHQVYANELQDFDQRLKMSITGRPELSIPFPDICNRFAPYFEWLKQSEVLSIRFEDFVRNTDTLLGAIFDHVVTRGFVPSVGRNAALRSLRSAIQPEKSPTFRKGMIGGWKEYFNEEHKSVFKDVCGQLLIDLGYEKDLNW